MRPFPIRETRIGRVVYAISSPMMGGLSKWNVLGDNEVSNVMPEVFGDTPEVAAGLHYREAAAVWRNWVPIFWLGIRFRGCLAEPADSTAPLDAAGPANEPALAAAFAGVSVAGVRAQASGSRRVPAPAEVRSQTYLTASAPA